MCLGRTDLGRDGAASAGYKHYLGRSWENVLIELYIPEWRPEFVKVGSQPLTTCMAGTVQTLLSKMVGISCNRTRAYRVHIYLWNSSV